MKEFFGVIDYPKSNQIIKGSFQLRGWVLSRSSEVFDIQITIDGLVVPIELRRIERPDVSKAHPNLAPNNLFPGFIATIDSQSIPIGYRTLACTVVQGSK